jgi:hypothetical protein
MVQLSCLVLHLGDREQNSTSRDSDSNQNLSIIVDGGFEAF